jgi:hypothetical protein
MVIFYKYKFFATKYLNKQFFNLKQDNYQLLLYPKPLSIFRRMIPDDILNGKHVPFTFEFFDQSFQRSEVGCENGIQLIVLGD